MTGPLKSFFGNMELMISSGYAYKHLYYSPLNYISKVHNTDSVDPKLKSFVDAMYWFQYQKQQTICLKIRRKLLQSRMSSYQKTQPSV